MFGADLFAEDFACARHMRNGFARQYTHEQARDSCARTGPHYPRTKFRARALCVRLDGAENRRKIDRHCNLCAQCTHRCAVSADGVLHLSERRIKPCVLAHTHTHTHRKHNDVVYYRPYQSFLFPSGQHSNAFRSWRRMPPHQLRYDDDRFIFAMRVSNAF